MYLDNYSEMGRDCILLIGAKRSVFEFIELINGSCRSNARFQPPSSISFRFFRNLEKRSHDLAAIYVSRALFGDTDSVFEEYSLRGKSGDSMKTLKSVYANILMN